MTTTIAPSTGAGVLFTQQGVGTTPGYSALDLRRSEIVGPVQEGVYAAGDFMVTQRGAGANMSVDIAAGSGAFAAVQGDNVTGQGLYVVGPHSAAAINETIAAADPSNPRIDIVILEIQDNVHDASGGNLARTRVLTGTATAGATLTNRNGVATLPGNALLLADVLVGAGAASIGNTVIRDRRKWARGMFNRVLGNIGGTPSTSTALTASSFVNAIFNFRVECSGLPIRVAFMARAQHSSASGQVDFQVSLDSATVQNVFHRHNISTAAGCASGTVLEDIIAPSAGSHTIGVVWGSNVASATIVLAAGDGPVMLVEEVVRQSTANNTTTTG